MSTKLSEFGGWKGLFLYTLLSAVLSGAVIGVILNWMFAKELSSWRTQREWESAALAEVIAPAVMHFERTKALAARYRDKPTYGEARFLRDSNSETRELLLSKAHLLPTELVTHSQCLLTHYDIWLKRFDMTLEEYRSKHRSAEPISHAQFDVGFAELEDAACGGFPEEVPRKFLDYFNQLRSKLYSLEAVRAAN